MKKVSDVFKNIRYAVGEPQAMQEDLRNWFNPNHPEGDWKRVNSKGEVVGDCAREPGEPKPKCMSRELRNSLTKKEKASAVRRKRKEDPNPERQGAPINVTNKVNQDMEQLDEKNKPTNPELWSRAIAQAKSKFDVYPSAYANGWASKWYKSKGGGWKTVSEAKEKSEYDYEGDMARGQLQSIINNAQRVHDMLKDNDNLPEWVQSKITLAEDYISTVSNYMMSEVDEEVVAEGKVMHRDFKSWANHAKSQGLKVRKSSNPIEWSNDAIDKEGNIRGRFVGSNIPQNSRGFIHKQVVAEDLLNELSKDTLKSYAKKAVPDMQASQKRSEIEAGKAVSTKDDETAKTHYDAAKQAKDRTEKRMAGISGAIKRVTNQGVTEEIVQEERGLWANIRAKRERIKNGSGERMRKPGSEGAPSEEILKKTQAIKEEHLEEGRPSQRHPLEGHEYHKKTDAELVHIAKDAHKAAEAMKSHNTTAENKYRDQANDSATVRYYRQKNGMADWYKKKYGHIKEEVVTEMDKSQTPPGRDGGNDDASKKEYAAKITTPKKVVKDGEKMLNKILKPKEEMKEEVKDEYARKVDKYLKKKYGKDDSQKKLPMGAGFAAARRKARLASNGRMDEALSPAIRMQMALKKAREDRERSERNGEAAMAGKFSSGPAKQPTKNHTLVSPKNEEVIVEDDVINKEPKLPFDEPTKKAIGKVKDKSGAVHTPMSRTKDIAKKAARRQAGIKEAADVNDPLDRIDTQAKRSLSRTAGMVKDLATNAKSKAKEKAKKDTFEAEPELSSQIMKQD
jgi:hypothetical protein